MVDWSCQACLGIHVWIPACAGMTRGEIYVVSKYVLYSRNEECARLFSAQTPFEEDLTEVDIADTTFQPREESKKGRLIAGMYDE